MKIKNLILPAVYFAGLSTVCAQNSSDLLRYSQSNVTGSARVLGAGGAWGAVGADLSSASINPAGLAFYRRNELLGSMAISSNSSDAKYIGSSLSDSRVNFNLP